MQLNLNTTFTPFTYEEMVAPLKDYTQAYKETETAYSDLVAQTEAWKDIANREKSPEAYEMYARYSNALNNVVSDFSKGMTASNRGALMKMKRDYARDIAPIARASEALDKAMQFRQEKGPDAVFEVDEYNSLDSFLHGQKANNKYILKSDVMKETAAVTEAAMREVAKDPEFKKVMGNQYWQIIQHSGGSWEDYEAAMKQAIGSNPILNNKFSQIKSDMLKKYDYSKYGAAGQQKIANAIDLGMAIGVDKETTTFQANQGFSAGGGRGGRGGGGGYGPKEKTDSESDDGAYIANNTIIEFTGDSNTRFTYIANQDANKPHGYPLSLDQVKRSPVYREAVLEIIGNSDPKQYTYHLWKDSRTKKTRLQVRRKGTPIKKGEGFEEIDTTEEF